jgi:RND family efflux transporter MFP subunit
MTFIRTTLLFASFAGLLLSGCGGTPPAAAAQKKGRPPAVVQVAPVQQGAFDVSARFVGRLNAQSSAELFARTDGPITAVHAGSGDRVRRGQLLAQIDPSDEQQAVEQARAALRMAEATLHQRTSAFSVARSQAQRSEKLFSENLLSESDLELARGERVSASSQVELARAQIEQARANLNAAQLKLEQTRVIAPFDGHIGTRHLDVGARAATNRPVFTIVDLSRIRTAIPVPASDAVHIRPGQTAILTVDVLPGRTFEGRVTRMSSVVDPQTNTVEAEIEVANPDGAIKPGMFASVAVAYRTEASALLVPQEAVQRNEQEQWLFVADPAADGEGHLARRVTVRAMESAERAQKAVAVEPLDGDLQPGMRVITLGQENLSDGARVMIGDPSRGAGGGKAGSKKGKGR